MSDGPARCRRCHRPIFEGDTGWYCQVPITVGGLTFMDRVTECHGEPHEPAQPWDEP